MVSLNGCFYRLSAIFSNLRIHYTAFYILENGECVFYDCMRDKQNGHSIPSITHVPGFQQYLDSGCNENFLPKKNDGESRDSYNDRVRNGAYAYVYTRTDDRSQPPEQTVPVLPPRLRVPIVDEMKVVPPPQIFSAGGGAAAFSRKPSASGGYAAVLAHPALSPKKFSAGGGAALRSPPPQKSSAGGGGAAAIQHQSPPSFGHMQSPKRPPSFIGKLQSLFPTLVICHYFANPVVYSGTYRPTEEDKKTNMCLLASVIHDATSSDNKTAGPFVYLAPGPGLTNEDVSKKHRLVTSFDINKQPYRLVAVVYSDDNVVACPEISSLPEGPPRNDLRKSFLAEIQRYSLSNSETTITRLVFFPCV